MALPTYSILCYNLGILFLLADLLNAEIRPQEALLYRISGKVYTPTMWFKY